MLCLFVLGFSALAFAAPEPLVYRRNEAPPTNGTLYPGNCEWELEGCYNEPSTGRILQYVNSDKSLTVEKCFQICAAFDYALVEFRSECWCGSTANPAATQFTGEGTGCRLACAGDADQLCGGQSKYILSFRENLIAANSVALGACCIRESRRAVAPPLAQLPLQQIPLFVLRPRSLSRAL